MTDAAGRHEVLIQHLRVIRTQLVCASRLEKTRFESGKLPLVPSKGYGRHSVKRRRLMQTNKWVGVNPVTAGSIAPVYQGDGAIRVAEQRVRERHACGTGTNHKVIGLKRFSHCLPPFRTPHRKIACAEQSIK